MQLSPEKEMKLAELRATNTSQTDIAEVLGVSQPTVSRNLQRPDIIQKIDEFAQKIQDELLPKAYENIEHVITNYKTTKNEKEKEHGYKASEAVLKGNGLLPSAVQSIYIQNSFNQQQNILNPTIKSLLDDMSHKFDELKNEEIEGEIE